MSPPFKLSLRPLALLCLIFCFVGLNLNPVNKNIKMLKHFINLKYLMRCSGCCIMLWMLVQLPRSVSKGLIYIMYGLSFKVAK